MTRHDLIGYDDWASSEARATRMKTPLNRRSFIQATASALALSGCPQGNPASSGLQAAAADRRKPAQRPNVILIMTDDQGYGDLGCHGNPVVKTPNLDKLASESLRFTNYHVHTVCSPTRAALMTGLNPARTGVTGTVGRREICRTDVPTMADWFKASGYHTALFGKWHIGDGYRYSPQWRGFEETWTVTGGGPGGVDDYWGNVKWDDVLLHNGKPTPTKGFADDAIVDKAIEFMKGLKKDEPFFIYLPTFAPHHPNYVPEEWSAAYKISPTLACFYASITGVDSAIGRLREFLAETKLGENTILIFMTDNGSSSAESRKRFSGGYPGGKGVPGEHNHRVPCFVHWPKMGLDKGRELNTLSAHMDWLPTFIDLCGLQKPQLEGLAFDGLSLAPLLTGKERGDEPAWRDRMILIDIKKGGPKVLKEDWRLIKGRLTNRKPELRKERNLGADHAELVASMKNFAREFRASVSRTVWKSERPIYAGQTPREPMIRMHGGFWFQARVLEAPSMLAGFTVCFLHDGKYEFEFRRWAPELDLPLDAGLKMKPKPGVHYTNGSPVFLNRGRLSRGRALPIRGLELEIDGKTYTAQAESGQPAVKVKIDVKKGIRTVRPVFVDKDGKPITMPYYGYVSRIQRGNSPGRQKGEQEQ